MDFQPPPKNPSPPRSAPQFSAPTGVPSYYGHRERVREKFRKTGYAGWQDYEILEFLLMYAIPKRDTKPLAKTLITRFGSLQAVLEAPEEKLLAVAGVGQYTTLLFKMLRETAQTYLKQRMHRAERLDSPQKVVEYLKAKLTGLSDETFCAVFLNSQNEVIEAETLASGTVSRAAVYPRKIAERALFHHAASVILAHNHPGGETTPSAQDVDATRQAQKALELMDIGLIDHIIIGRNGYFSFADEGLL